MRISKTIRLIIIVLLALYGLFVLLSFILPPLMKGFVEQKAGEALKSHVQLGHFSVNPFTLSVHLDSFTASKEGRDPWLSWDSLYVNAQWRSVWQWGGHLDAFIIVNPYVLVELDSSQKSNATESERTPSAPISPDEMTNSSRNQLPLSVHEFAMRGGAFELIDSRNENAKKVRMAPINFTLEKFSTEYQLGKNNQYDLHFQGPEGGMFRWSGNLQWAPFASKGEMEIKGLDVLQFQDFYQNQIPILIRSGSVDFRTHYHVFEKPALGVELDNAVLTVNQLGLASQDTLKPLLQLDSVRIGPLNVSTLERELRLDEIFLYRPRFFFQLNNTAVNKKDEPKPRNLHFDFFQFDSTAVDSVFPNSDPLDQFVRHVSHLPKWMFHIGQFQVLDASIEVRDSLVAKGILHSVDSIQIQLAPLTNRSQDSVQVLMNAKIHESARLQLKAMLHLFPLKIQGSLDINQWALPKIQPYLIPYTSAILRDGSLSSQIRYSVVPALDSTQTDQATVEASLVVQNLLVDGPDAKRVVSLGALDVKNVQLDYPSLRTQVGPVKLSNTSLHLQRLNDTSYNVSQLWRESSSKKNSQNSKTVSPRVSVSRFQMSGVSFSFADYSLNVPFIASVKDISGHVNNLDNQVSRPSALSVKGNIDGYAPFDVVGSVNLGSTTPELDLKIRTRSQELVAFTPYTGKFIGYKVSKGLVETDFDYQIQNQQINGKNHIVMRQFTLGESVESSDAVDLPVKLGVALLTDKNGVIDLGFGIQGDLNDPSFSISGMVWQVIRNLLAKAANAPLKSLMALVGSEASMESIVFEEGSSIIQDSTKQQLTQLSLAMAQRPALQMEVQGYTDSLTDGRVLKERLLIQKMASVHHLDPAKIHSQSVVLKPLRDTLLVYVKSLPLDTGSEFSLPEMDSTESALQMQTKKLWEQLVQRQPLPRQELVKLGALRAQAIKRHMLQADSTVGARVFVVEPKDSTRMMRAAIMDLLVP